MKETKQSAGTALGSLWNVEMQEDGSVLLWSDLFDTHPRKLTPNEAFALLDYLYERRDVLCRHAYRDKQEMN